MDATQQKGSPKQLRGRSLGTKLSEAEYAQCEQSAARRGQTLSEGAARRSSTRWLVPLQDRRPR